MDEDIFTSILYTITHWNTKHETHTDGYSTTTTRGNTTTSIHTDLHIQHIHTLRTKKQTQTKNILDTLIDGLGLTRWQIVCLLSYSLRIQSRLQITDCDTDWQLPTAEPQMSRQWSADIANSHRYYQTTSGRRPDVRTHLCLSLTVTYSTECLMCLCGLAPLSCLFELKRGRVRYTVCVRG